jgi:hypothetical protein
MVVLLMSMPRVVISVVAMVALLPLSTESHPQYMLSKCKTSLKEGNPMMKGPAWATSDAGVRMTASRDGVVLQHGDVFRAGETLYLGTTLTQGGLAMDVSTGIFAETDASRSTTLPQSIGCSSTRISNWIGTHIDNGVVLTTPLTFPWQAPSTCSGSLTITCGYATDFETVSIIPALTLQCCPSVAQFDVACSSARKSSVGNCLVCVSSHAEFARCSGFTIDIYCSGGH